ncbi:MAG: flagellar biosynthetic protein FliO [Methylococcaceae bacterium]
MILTRVVRYGLLLCCMLGHEAFAVVANNKETLNIVSISKVMTWMLGLFFVIAIFLAAIWLLRKLGPLSPLGNKQFRIVAGLSLGGRERVVIVQTGSKQLVLGVSPGRINALHVLEDDDLLAAQVPGDNFKSFAQRLKQVQQGYGHDKK